MCKQNIRIFAHPRNTLRAVAVVSALVVAGCSRPESTPEKFETVPLASIHTTSGQKGLKRVSVEREGSPYSELVAHFFRVKPWASNLFLTVARDLDGAVEAGLRFKGGEELTLPKEGDRSRVWLVVFLGFRASGPPQWNIESVQRSRTKVRVTYSPEPEAFQQRTRDLEPYFYWVPLPAPPPVGSLDLELHDSAAREVVLFRKVRIKQAEH